MFDYSAIPLSFLGLVDLHNSGGLLAHFPEVEALYGVPQSAAHHPEICTGAHIELCLAMATQLSATPAACFATLVHDLGKGVTPSHEWPKHHQHETAGLPLVTSVCSRLGVPDYWTQLALFVCEKHIVIHRSFELRPRTVVTLVDQMTRGHGSTFMEDALVACESDARGRLGFENKAYPQGAFLREVGQALQAEAATACLLRTNREEQAAHLRRLAMVRQIQKKFVAGT